MIVETSSRRAKVFVLGVLVAAAMPFLANVVTNVLYRCPCGFAEWWGIIFGCNPCMAHFVGR